MSPSKKTTCEAPAIFTFARVPSESKRKGRSAAFGGGDRKCCRSWPSVVARRVRVTAIIFKPSRRPASAAILKMKPA